jgi:hypothetical protein
VWRRAAWAALIFALVCWASAWCGEIALSVFQDELPTKAFCVFGVQRIPVLKTSEEKDFARSVDCLNSLIFWNRQFNRVFGGKGAGDGVDNDESVSIPNDSGRHLTWQCVARLYAKSNIFHREGASARISETPEQIHGNEAALVRFVVKPANSEFHKIDIWLLRLRLRKDSNRCLPGVC